ncbi:MAG: hypothetical protein ABIQ93_04605 [Saprospiraceae bacterium]
MKHLLIGLLALPSILAAQSYLPGQSYFGANDYIEYVAGNLPLILSAPHGGSLKPAGIPDRDCAGCSYLKDTNTQELARAVAEAIFARTGCYPHLVINRLHRVKMDANRDLPEAADGDSIAGQAWSEFQGFLETAGDAVSGAFGKGLYIDLHGHAHPVQRLELGYLLSKNELQLPDGTLNFGNYVGQSSLRRLALLNADGANHSALLRGEYSLGTMLSEMGYPAVPSATEPFPQDTEAYFDGGYNTGRHGSRGGGAIDGIQIECHWTGVRDSTHNRLRFADSLSVALLAYLEKHYFGALAGSWCAALPGESASHPATDSVQVFPNPYCSSFFIQTDDPDGVWTAAVYDFAGNLLYDKTLPAEVSPKGREKVWVVLRKNGQVVAMRAVLRYCR